MLEDSMVIAPKESTLFSNREKFDLITVYDENSTSFGTPNSPLSVLIRAISEQAFKKILKRMPMMLVGGIEAWKRDIGEDGIVRGEPVASVEAPKPISVSASMTGFASSPPTGSLNPFVNGFSSSTSTTASMASSTTWASSTRLRADTSSSGYDHQLPGSGHRPSFSLDQAPIHSRCVSTFTAARRSLM